MLMIRPACLHARNNEVVAGPHGRGGERLLSSKLPAGGRRFVARQRKGGAEWLPLLRTPPAARSLPLARVPRALVEPKRQARAISTTDAIRLDGGIQSARQRYLCSGESASRSNVEFHQRPHGTWQVVDSGSRSSREESGRSCPARPSGLHDCSLVRMSRTRVSPTRRGEA